MQSLIAVTDLLYVNLLPYSATVAVAGSSPIFTDALSGQGRGLTPILHHPVSSFDDPGKMNQARIIRRTITGHL